MLQVVRKSNTLCIANIPNSGGCVEIDSDASISSISISPTMRTGITQSHNNYQILCREYLLVSVDFCADVGSVAAL